MTATSSITARPITPADDAFLQDVFASSREAEMAAVPWPEQTKRGFLIQQYTAQHAHYFAHFPSAKFWIVELDEIPVGRYYLDRQADQLHILDLTLLPDFRNRGIATSLIAELLREADSLGIPVNLYVEQNNPAQTLYRRLGFQPVRDEGIYWFMERPTNS